MSLFSDYRTKFDIARNSGCPRIVRIFAVAEMVCLPVSLVAILLAIVLPLMRHFALWNPPTTVSVWVLPIFVSAAIGYLTNWIAITMLFEPYERTWRHWLVWVTFGAWRQGLMPRNKDRIAVVLADQVATKLLRPEKLADDLCEMVGSALQDQETLSVAQKFLQEQVAAHDSEIIDFLVPRIEAALINEIDRLVTPERVTLFWNDEIMPRLESTETRQEVTRIALEALRKRAPEIAVKAKPAITRAVRNYVEKKFDGSWMKEIPIVGAKIADKVSSFLILSADSIADKILDEETVEEAFRDWIQRPETSIEIRDELVGFISSIREWFASPDGAARIGGFVGDIRAKFRDYLRDYLRTNMTEAASRLIKSEATWSWVSRAVPALRPGIERMVREIGTRSIIEKLDVEGRVKSAVDGMDMAEFHAMLSTVMAEHLGAIQVLGYLLGAIAGILLVI